jgi:DNA-binding transcriptional LysR family regulator
MNGFDLNLLLVLVALHRTRSVSTAAAELDLSQPGTSLAL